MNILAIDTTTKVASVSFLKQNVIYHHQIDNEITHSEKLLPLIDQTLKEANVTIANVDEYACMNGPGSFTGIRIGLATLKAFAQVQNKKIFSLTSLDTIAYSAFLTFNVEYIISIIDAKNDRIYYQMTKLQKQKNGKISLTSVIEPSNELIDDAIYILKKYLTENAIKNVVVAGNAVNQFKDKLSVLSQNLSDFYPTPTTLITALSQIENPAAYTFDAYT